MDESSAYWIVLVSAAIVAGASVVGVLALQRWMEPVCFLTLIAGTGASTYALVTLTRLLPTDAVLVYAFAFALAAAGGGYALAATALPSLGSRVAAPRPPDLPLPEPSGAIAVIVSACGEPVSYSPAATAVTLNDLAAEGLLDLSIASVPFMFFGQKSRYRLAGGSSPAYTDLESVASSLVTALRAEVTDVVDWAPCAGDRRLATRVAAAAEAGHRTIIVVELGVATSLQMAAAKREVDALRLENLGVDVVYAPIRSPQRLALAVAERAAEAAGEPTRSGVVLLGHGQPAGSEKRNPGFEEAELIFLNQIRVALTERGFPDSNVRVAWAEWVNPDVTSATRHLAAVGCERVVIVPAVFPLDTLTTRVDLEVAARRSRTEGRISVAVLPAWKDDSAVIADARAAVVQALREPRED